MIKRAPSWAWVVLAIIVSVPMIVGSVLLVPKHGDAKAAPAATSTVASGVFCVKIPLAGPGNWVGPVGITTHVDGEVTFVPGGWKYIVDGPSSVREKGSDGRVIGIYDSDPLPSGAVYFDGPAGETFTVKMRPPDGEYVC